MPALRNPRYEAFAQAYVRGANAGNAAACYRAAFGQNSAMSAYRLRHRNEVARRIDELIVQAAQNESRATERAVARLAITKETVLAELARIAFANLRDYVRPGGADFLDLSELDPDKSAALQEATVHTIENADGKTLRRVRYKLADKQTALVTLGRHLGLFVDRRRVTVEHTDTPDADLVSRAREIIAFLLDAGIDLGVVARIRPELSGDVAPVDAQPALPLPAVSEAADVPCGGGET